MILSKRKDSIVKLIARLLPIVLVASSLSVAQAAYSPAPVRAAGCTVLSLRLKPSLFLSFVGYVKWSDCDWVDGDKICVQVQTGPSSWLTERCRFQITAARNGSATSYEKNCNAKGSSYWRAWAVLEGRSYYSSGKYCVNGEMQW
jgi:hypothetical protein